MSRDHFSLLRRVALLLSALLLSAPTAFAQGGGVTAPLSGLVVDRSGAVMPGAHVLVRNTATTATYEAITDSVGRFTVPALNPGLYTVTISISGFKTALLPDVPLVAATPANVKAVLEIGNLEETVVVTGSTEMVQTQTAAVQTTIELKQVEAVPLVTRTALNYVTQLPGVGSTSGTRNSTISGLPMETINITLDGINAQDNRAKDDGLFMLIRPLMDSIEEITVSTATMGAESAGQGATQIRMITRAGSNRFSGAVYDTWRNQAGVTSDDVLTRNKKSKWIWRLNTPTFFTRRDMPKTAAGDHFINDVRLQTPGFRVGGPVLKDRLFYFFNQEWFRYPSALSATRSLMKESARQGIFTYPATDGSGNKTVNLLAIAAEHGQTATQDPTIAKLLADIRQAASSEGAIESRDQNVDKYTSGVSRTDARFFPTLRTDYNMTSAHRLTFSARYLSFKSKHLYPATFPGFPNEGGQYSGRYMWQGTLRSTLGSNMVNEARLGAQDMTGRGGEFYREVSEGQFNCAGLGCQSAGGQGWALGINAFRGITNPGPYIWKGGDAGPLFTVEDTLTWLRGTHTVGAGGSYTHVTYRYWGDTVVPNVSFGLTSLDSVAYAMLDATSGHYPGGISPTWAGYARNLYAVLTGRVTAVTGDAYLNPEGHYVYLGEETTAASGTNLGFHVSDSWRARPNLTLTAGVRYELQLPFTGDSQYTRPDSWQMVYGVTGAGSGSIGQRNLYHPGILAGSNPLVVPYEKGRPAYNTDWNNIAPSVGVAWRPTLKTSSLTKILSTEPVIRGGYTLTYTRLGTNFFDWNYYYNPGRSRAATRSTTAGTPVLGSDTAGAPQVFPVLLRDTQRLFPSAFPDTPTFPITPAVNETIDIHYPDWPLPHTHQYSAGFQRELGKSMAMDIRYVGNTNVGGWASWNMNATPQWSMLAGENGFYDEFRLAQANLRANIVAGKGNTFAYTGAPGTAPLPIFMAYLQGIPVNDARSQVAANYTASQFKSSAWYGNLSMYSPGLTSIAGTGSSGLQYGIGSCGGDPTSKGCTGFDRNRLNAGLPINFFMANPAVAQGIASLETTAGNTRYDSLQFELRRRMSQGLLLAGSYVYEFGRRNWMQRSLREDWFYVDSTGGPRHNFKFNWVLELPFGRGRKFGGSASRSKDLLIGGWEVNGAGWVQSGVRFDYGNYRLVGMSEQEFASLFKFYRVQEDGKTQIYMLPQDVIQQSIVALYNASPTDPTGYADGRVPTGRYLAPASGPDCVQYLPGMCPGTKAVRIVTAPVWWNVDVAFVKRIALVKNVRLEARMDLYNIFNVMNFIPTSAMGSAVSDWRVTGVVAEYADQYLGGRMTQFGLRVTW